MLGVGGTCLSIPTVYQGPAGRTVGVPWVQLEANFMWGVEDFRMGSIGFESLSDM